MARGKRTGGPKTDTGKIASSKNALKSGAYSTIVILPGEQEEQFRELESSFINDFRPGDTAQLAMVHDLAVLTWKKLRLDKLEQQVILEKLNWPISSYETNHSNLLKKYQFDEYPRLYKRVMQVQKEGASFLGVLGTQYKQSTPIMNLAGLMNDLKDKYPHHFNWAGDSVRYQKIIDGLRAEQMELAMDLDKTNRHATSIQNRIDKAIATLAKLDLHESQLRNQLTLQSKVIEDEKLSSSELKGSELELIQSS